MSNSLLPHEPQHARPPCSSPTPGVYPNPCPSSQWCHLTISSSVVPFSRLQPFPTSGSSNESALRRWPKYWSFSFNISPSSEHPGLISFRMDWLDLFAVQGTLKSLLQHHSSKASILLCSAFFILQLSYPYTTTGKTIALTRLTLVDKVMSLLFNMLSRLVITFLPGSKLLLISWLQSPSSVILESRKIKSATVSPSICHEVMGLDAMILVFWVLSFRPTFSLSSFTFIKRHFIFFLICCFAGFSLIAASGGHSSLQCLGFPSLLLPWSMGSRHTNSVVVVEGLSCSAACGIFPDQGSNPCSLHQQVDSLSLDHQRSPIHASERKQFIKRYCMIHLIGLPTSALKLAGNE